MEKLDLDEMRRRIDNEIKKQRRSRAEVSNASGNSSGYLTNVITRGQVPTVDRLDAIARELGVSVNYLMYGTKSSDVPQEFGELMESSPEMFRALLVLAKKLR